MHVIKAEIKVTIDPDTDVYVVMEITYDFRKGHAAVMYLRNGDPGYPAEPAEVDFIDARLIDGDGLNPTQEQIDQWAEDWLAGDGYELACEYALPSEPDPDAAYEAKRDRQMERD